MALVVSPRGGVIKAMCFQQLVDMPQQEQLNRGDVLAALERVARMAWNKAQTPMVMPLVMLVGGLLLGFEARRKRSCEVPPEGANISAI